MRVLDVTLLLAVPAVGVPLHAEFGHLVVDSALGLVVGVGLVALYLLALRWLDRSRDADGEERSREPYSGPRSREP